MSDTQLGVSPRIQRVVGNRAWSELHRYPGAPNRVFVLTGRRGIDLVVKIGSDLGSEAARLSWMTENCFGSIKTPEVVLFEKDGDIELDHLVMTYLPGVDGDHYSICSKPRRMVETIAGGIRWLHGRSEPDCAFRAGVTDLVGVATAKVDAGFNIGPLRGAYYGMTASDLLSRMRRL